MGELTIAKSAGFCFGVTRAVNMVYEAIEKENVPIHCAKCSRYVSASS